MSVSSIFIVGLIALTSFQEGLAGRCGSNFTDAAGSFKSPGFPLQYDNNLDCDWFISPNKTSVFYIRSLYFDTEVCCDLVTVSVRTSAGVDQLLVMSGNTPLSVAFMIDRGDVVIVHFHSDSSIVRTGFRLEYSTPVVPCGGNLTSDEGNLTSPGWPVQSRGGLSCDWFLSSNVTASVFLRSFVFYIGVNAELAVSVLKANTSTEEAMIVTHLNEGVHDIVHIERGDVLHFRFTTNSTISQGFQLYYNAKDTCPDESMYYQCANGACIPASLKCNAVNDCLDNSDELPSTCTDGCSNESLYHCANGQCVVGYTCNGIVECDDQSDESQECLVSEVIVVGDSLQATVDLQPSQQIRVSLCSDDLCEAIILYGLSPDQKSLTFESYGQCSYGSCDVNSLENYNYPSGSTAFAAAAWQFYVTIREESLSVGWNNASSDDAILPLTSVSGKRLLISPRASTTWINQTTEDPSSLSTESTTDAPHSSSVTSEAPNPTAITSSTTSASSIAPANTSTTYSLAPVTTTMTSAASTRTPATTAPTTAFPTAMSTTASTSTPNSPAPISTVTTPTFAPTYTSTGRFTVTTPQPAATTTTPASTSGWTTITTGTSRPTVRPTVISTSTTQASSTPYATTSDQTPTWTTTEQSPTSSSTTPTDPDFPTSSTPTPTPSATWPPVPPPPDCPTDFPLRYQYLLIPVESHPQLYVICFAGWGQSMKCPQPLIFSYKQQKCIWSWN